VKNKRKDKERKEGDKKEGRKQKSYFLMKF
jgi:hypothetical protein